MTGQEPEDMVTNKPRKSRRKTAKPILTDPNGTASALSAEAMAALAQGDTATAQQKHHEAGGVLERRMKAVSRAREKHLLAFLAATQFYKGGHYQHAAELAQKIEPKFLDARSRSLLPGFLEDVRDRSSSGYRTRITKQLNALWSARDWEAVLSLLADHPYRLTPGGTAWTRGVSCLQLGHDTAAVRYFALALQNANLETRALTIHQACFHPIDLAASGKIEEASRFTQLIVDHLPTPVVDAALAFVEYVKLVHAPEPERNQHAQAQLAAMSRLDTEVRAFLASVTEDAQVRRIVVIAAGASALTARWLDRKSLAERYRALARELDREKAMNLDGWFEHWDILPGASELLDSRVQVVMQRAKEPWDGRFPAAQLAG